MDLFLDTNYKKDCENKICYYDALFSSSIVHTGYTLVGGGTITKLKSRNVLLVFGQVNDIHLVKDLTKEYCYEVKLSQTIKKFVL